MYRELIFDIETQKLFDQIEDRNNLPLLGVSIVSAYKRELDDNFQEVKGEMRSFWQDELEKLEEWFEGVDRVIGFNSLKFDVPVLAPHFKSDITKKTAF